MNETNTVIRERRSVRRYENKQVSEELLKLVLESVKYSPSWANTQCWEIVVIKDPITKENIQTTITPKNPATKALVDAPVLLAVCGKLKQAGYYKDIATTKYCDWFMFDLGIATQSICLSAQSLGLGTVIVGSFDHAKAHDILKLPEDTEVVVLIPLGYPAQSPKAPKRKELNEFVHYETF